MPFATPFSWRSLYHAGENYRAAAHCWSPGLVRARVAPGKTVVAILGFGDEAGGLSEILVNGRKASPRTTWLIHEGETFHLSVAGASPVVFVEFDAGRVRAARGGHPTDARATADGAAAMVADPLLSALRSTAANVPPDFRGIGDNVERAVRDLQGALDGVPRLNMADRKYSLFRQIEQFIEENLTKSFYNKDLYDRLAVSPRTLHNVVEGVTRISVQKYVKTRRLWRAREGLRAATPEELVKTVAIDNGFWHLGRFSAEYGSFFGESPNQTKRAANAIEAS